MQILGQSMQENAQKWAKYAKICKFLKNILNMQNKIGLISKGIF